MSGGDVVCRGMDPGARSEDRAVRVWRRSGPAAAAVTVMAVLLTGCSAGTDPPSPDVTVIARLVGPSGSPEVRPVPVPEGRSTVRSVPPGLAGPSSTPPGDGASAGATPSPSPTPTGPAYRAAVSEITPEIGARMTSSWRPGCPVPLDDLRYVTVTHWDMTGNAVPGELVVYADVADGVVEVFRALFDARYPIASMRLVDDFDGSDDASMAADNTSAFNCRAITGGTSWSEHAYGRAIDVNPVENPYVRASGRAAPREGQQFVDRHQAPGVIQPDDVVVQAFAASGWQWGGYWDYPIDYQHFSTTGR